MELHAVSHSLLSGRDEHDGPDGVWPDDAIDDRAADQESGKLGGSESAQRLLLLGLWLCFIFAGYVVARLGCYVGLPQDGTTTADAFDFVDDVSKMFQSGVVLGVFLRVMDRDRFDFLFKRSGWYFIPTFLGTPPVYSLISNVPAFQHSLADIWRWGWGMWTLEIVAVSAALASIGWHAQAAWRCKSRANFVAYVSSRAVVILFYVGAALLLSASGSRYSALHVHHLYLGWCVASWAEFDHPISVVTLALGLGIFVQGIGAFSFASNFEDPACFTTRPATKLGCSFAASTPFSISVCPGEGGGVYAQHQCTIKA